MNDLLSFVNTPAGQHSQMQHLGGATFIPAGSGKMAIFVGAGASLMAVPHHGLTEMQATSPYDLLTVDVADTLQYNLYSVVSNFGYLRERLRHSSEAVKNVVEMNLNIMHGNPVFRGTRIPIYQIIEELADGTPLHELVEGYPSLTLAQIQCGLDFASSVVRIYDDELSDR
jgi:uncharacterized protein (DUF433 family)